MRTAILIGLVVAMTGCGKSGPTYQEAASIHASEVQVLERLEKESAEELSVLNGDVDSAIRSKSKLESAISDLESFVSGKEAFIQVAEGRLSEYRNSDEDGSASKAEKLEREIRKDKASIAESRKTIKAGRGAYADKDKDIKECKDALTAFVAKNEVVLREQRERVKSAESIKLDAEKRER